MLSTLSRFALAPAYTCLDPSRERVTSGTQASSTNVGTMLTKERPLAPRPSSPRCPMLRKTERQEYTVLLTGGVTQKNGVRYQFDFRELR